MSHFVPVFLTMVLFWFTTDVHAAGQDQQITIHFDDSAARHVLQDPAKALQTRDQIWNDFEGYRITRVWHEESSYPLTWELWDKRLNQFVEDDALPEQSLKLLDDFRVLETREHSKIEQHLATYLPETSSFDAHVHFIAFTIPYAFTVEKNKIGMEINAHEWHNDPECLLNTVIHELFHVGYRLNTPDIDYLESEPANRDQFIAFHYAYLFNEGMATHVAYRALDLFPSEYKHEDYKLLEEETDIRKAINAINDLLEMTQTMSVEKQLESLWDIGVMQRAYYVAGAYICGAIEEKYGQDYLSVLVSKGGLDLVQEYNKIAAPGLEINVLEHDA